jgi:hypothetical protein
MRCDQSIARKGDACWIAETDACSEDGHTLLRCASHERSLAVACRGPLGCEPEGFFDGKGTLDRAFCDQSVADVGEACVAEGAGACSSDGRALLACRSGKFAQVSACVGEPCKRGEHGLLCRRPP